MQHPLCELRREDPDSGCAYKIMTDHNLDDVIEGLVSVERHISEKNKPIIGHEESCLIFRGEKSKL